MIDDRPHERTRGEAALAIGREALVVLLAFVAGFGGYFSNVKAEPTLQDYLVAFGAGALLALAKMIPTYGGQNRG